MTSRPLALFPLPRVPLPLVLLSFWIGLYPKPVWNVIEPSVQRLVRQVNKVEVYPESVVALHPTATNSPAVAASGTERPHKKTAQSTPTP